jgi:hypothetical protein
MVVVDAEESELVVEVVETVAWVEVEDKEDTAVEVEEEEKGDEEGKSKLLRKGTRICVFTSPELLIQTTLYSSLQLLRHCTDQRRSK